VLQTWKLKFADREPLFFALIRGQTLRDQWWINHMTHPAIHMPTMNTPKQ
jgi:hypothetical protein